MRVRTFFLDQGETLGGAERFLLDFFKNLTPSEISRLSPAVVGGKLESYRHQIPEGIKILKYKFPSVKGNWLRKISAGANILSSAQKLKTLVHKEGNAADVQIFANTPRTIFVGFLAKKIFGLKARFIVMIHDFTIPPKLLKRICATADVIIANSVITRQTIRGHIHPQDCEKIKIVENGVDFHEADKYKALFEKSASPKIEKIALVGRIDPRKGQMYALEAADLLQERNPHLKFFIVGASFSGDQATTEYEKEVRQFAKERNLKNVFFLDEVEQPFEIFATADMALVLPTEDETFGRVVIEALAMKAMVLAFDRNGPRQILQTFATFAKKSADFLLVEPENSMTLAEKIGFFADNPHEAEGYIENARKFVEEKYNLNETKKHLFRILTER